MTTAALAASPQVKLCAACEQEKPHSDFYESLLYDDGLTPRCKTCIKAGTEQWRRERDAILARIERAKIIPKGRGRAAGRS